MVCSCALRSTSNVRICRPEHRRRRSLARAPKALPRSGTAHGPRRPRAARTNRRRRNTWSMAVLEKRVSATKWVTPSGRAARSRRSRRRVPRPCRWWSSATTKATSASVVPGRRSRRPTPTIAEPSMATKATRSRPSTWVKCSTSAAESSGCTAKNRLRIDSADSRAVERDEASTVIGRHRADAHIGRRTVHRTTASGAGVLLALGPTGRDGGGFGHFRGHTGAVAIRVFLLDDHELVRRGVRDSCGARTTSRWSARRGPPRTPSS